MLCARGGSGGNEPECLEVPLIVYQGGSNLGGKKLSAAPRFNAEPLMTTDIAPTVCALLGIPIPRTSQGVYIDDVLLLANEPKLLVYYKDLFKQQQYFTRQYLEVVGKLKTVEANPVLTKTFNDATIKEYRDSVLEVQSIYQNARLQILEEQQIRNMSLTGALCMGLVVVIL